jgi:hypothetical protein
MKEICNKTIGIKMKPSQHKMIMDFVAQLNAGNDSKLKSGIYTAGGIIKEILDRHLSDYVKQELALMQKK